MGGVIAGCGGLIKTGAGRLTLLGENAYTGGTTIIQGTLRMGDGGTAARSRATSPTTASSPSTTPTISPMAAQSSRARASSTNSAPAGSSSAATTAIPAARSSTATLSVAADANLGAASSDLVINGGALENTAAFATARAIRLANDGTFLTTADLTAGGTISGPGRLTKAGGGRLTLVGTNNYSGAHDHRRRHPAHRRSAAGPVRSRSATSSTMACWRSTAPMISLSPAPSPAPAHSPSSAPARSR